MTRVVIVEDEFIVRYGIRSMIDWDKVGLTLIGEASNGQEALDLIQQDPPDILITDIKMPVMDGIALIAEVRKSSPHMKIIILSNLEDFQYAKEAIRYGVSEYLIKSDMMPRDFEQALIKVKETLAGSDAASGKKQLPDADPAWKEKLLLELAESPEKDSAYIHKSLHSLGISDAAAKLPLYVLHISKNALELSIPQGQEYIRSAVEQVMANGSYTYETFPDRQGEMNVILLPGTIASPEAGEVREIAIKLLEALMDSGGMLCTIGVSRGISAWTHLGEGYKQAAAAAKHKMFLGNGKAIMYGTDYVPADRDAGGDMKVGTNHIHSMVYAFQSKELKAYLEDLFGQLAARQDMDAVQIISLELLIILTSLWSDVSSDQPSILQLKKQYFDQLSRLETLQESKVWFQRAYDDLVRHLIEVYSSDRNSIVKAAQYIQQHYHQEISLQSVSSLVHLSKNYFANLFKKEMGESFLEHVTRIRIEKAKSLLGGELKTADIGHLVGIPDPKYFSKVFKKITGVSPSEYRNRVRGTAE